MATGCFLSHRLLFNQMMWSALNLCTFSQEKVRQIRLYLVHILHWVWSLEMWHPGVMNWKIYFRFCELASLQDDRGAHISTYLVLVYQQLVSQSLRTAPRLTSEALQDPWESVPKQKKQIPGVSTKTMIMPVRGLKFQWKNIENQWKNIGETILFSKNMSVA